MGATIVNGGRWSWEGERDKDGHRTWNLTTLVQSLHADGPAVVLSTPGLPQIGDVWQFGNDVDLWAFCWPNATIRYHDRMEGDPHRFWTVQQLFTTKPLERCQDTTIEDPLMEPDRISGSFIKYTEESSEDRNGKTIKSSSHEIFVGPQVEWDANRPTVVIEQNRAALELDVLSELLDQVNDATLWDLSARKVKFSNASWERKWYGVCNIYFTRRLEFDINFDTFDRDIPDQGTMVLKGKWDRPDNPTTWIDEGLDKNDPLNFMKFKDFNDEYRPTLLDGEGKPLTQGTGTGAPDPVTIKFEKYDQDNLLRLGIPTDLTAPT